MNRKKTLLIVLAVLVSASAQAGFVLVNDTAPPVSNQGGNVATVTLPGVDSNIKSWSLIAGEPVHKQLYEWAKQAGWTFEWRLDKTWMVPASIQVSGSFDIAISEVVEMLYAQGKPVRLVIWSENKYAEVIDVDAK